MGGAKDEAREVAADRAALLDRAELGDGRSQYGLGLLALRGEGVAGRRGEAAGWMLAARENGHDPEPRKLDELVAQLEQPEREVAEAVVARFGRAALLRMVLPDKAKMPSAGFEPPRLLSSKRDVNYPFAAGHAGTEAVVLVRTLIGLDGSSRDPELIFSEPPASKGGQSFIAEVMRGVVARRYAPARLQGHPVAVLFTFKVKFRMPEGARSGSRSVGRVDLVDPREPLATAIPSSSGPAESWETAQSRAILAAAQAGQPEAQLMVGRSLARSAQRTKALPWLSRAAAAGLPAGRVAYGLELLREPDPPFEKVRALLTSGAPPDDPYALRRAIQALACTGEPRLRSPEAAAEMAKRSRIRDDTDPLSAEATAAALSAVGDFPAAAEAERQAIRTAKWLGWDVDPMNERLVQYEAHRPCERDFLPETVVEWPPPL